MKKYKLWIMQLKAEDCEMMSLRRFDYEK